MEFNNRTLVFLDLETIAGDNKPESEELALDKRLKDPVKIEADKEKKLADALKKQDEAWRKYALNPFLGEIFCASIAINDEETYSIVGVDEEELLNNLLKELKALDTKYGLIFIGHNLIEFDAYFIFIKSLKYGIPDLLTYFSNKHGVPLVDTMVMASGSKWKAYVSLNALSKLLGLKGKEGMDGSQVHDYWQEKRGQEICDYCNDDVELTRACYKKMVQCGLVG